MRIKLFTILAFLSIADLLSAQAPSWSWAKNSGGADFDEAYRVATDAAGNVFVVGTFNSPTITIGTTTLTNQGQSDVFIAKYDSSGNFQWANSIGGSSYDAVGNVATDLYGNVFVAGVYDSPTLSIGGNTLSNSGGSDVFYVKYDPTGNVIWAKSCGSSGFDESDAIATDGCGNLLMIGIYQNATMHIGNISLPSSGDNDTYVAKFDVSGNVMWANAAHGGGIDDGVGITSDLNNNVYIAGYSTSTNMTFGGNVTLSNSSGGNIFVAKYDDSGNIQWARNSSSGGAGFSYNSIRSDRFGNEYVIGNIFSSLTFGNTTLNNGSGAFIVKYDTSGNVVWAKSISVGTGNDLAIDASANVFATGYFSGGLTVGSTSITASGSTDTYIVKLDSSGNGVWAVTPTGSTGDVGEGIAVDGGGNALLAGTFSGSDVTFGSTTLSNNGSGGMFVAKLGNNSIAAGSTGSGAQAGITPSGPTSFCQGDSVTLTASPGTSYLWSNSATTQSITVKAANSYTVSVSYSGNCKAVSPPVNVSVSPAAGAGTIGTAQTPVCSDSAVQLLLTGSSGTPVHWQVSFTPGAFADIPGAADTAYSDSLKGVYYFRVYVGAGSCTDTSAAFLMTVNSLPAPGAPVTNDSLICSSDSTRLYLSENYSSYRWSDGDTTPYTYVSIAGGYWVTVTDGNGCSAVSGHENISVYPVLPVSVAVQGDTLSSFNSSSYQWFFDDAPLPGDTLPVYVAHRTGEYAIQVVDTNGCRELSQNTPITVAGLHESAVGWMNIYPDPFSNAIFITGNDLRDNILSIRIYNVLGEEVLDRAVSGYNSNTMVIDASTLPEGSYYLVVKTSDTEYVKENDQGITGSFCAVSLLSAVGGLEDIAKVKLVKM